MLKSYLKVMKKLLAVLLVVTVLLAGGCAYIDITPPPATTTAPPANTVPPTPINPAWSPPAVTVDQTPSLPLPSIADVVEAVKPSVVAIDTEVATLDFFNRPFTQEGAGSGWIIDSDGLIVTNNHVVEGARTITVTLDNGDTYTVDPKNIFTDQLNDLAILKIDASGLPPLKIGNSARLRVGDWVVAIGNSLGLGISAKQGIISRKGVSVPVDQGQTLYDLIETSAAINPGNSGGPLVNLAGEVIGITSAKIATIGVEGMGYAISTDIALPIIQQLIKNGYVIRPWMGVNLRIVDQLLVIRYRLAVDRGVFITEVAAGSPAAAGGLTAGDVIVAINGKDVATAPELVRTVHASRIGESLELTFYRGNSKLTAQVIPVESPPP
ncbi:MAG: trypsin-like peptidase domain-containing protein [Chloroflexi bacterium]|nr:trypsin-like peptidase domain-containing protein [Chloroflexota bacterium]